MDTQDQFTEWYATILFADIVDSTAMAEELNLSEYTEVIAELQDIAKRLGDSLRGSSFQPDLSTRGDEICLVLYASDNEREDWATRGLKIQRSVQLAVNVATMLKLEWLVSPYNQRRLKDKRLPRDLAVGIHCGTVLHGPHPFAAPDSTPEGFAISVAKRVESTARNGTSSRIVISDPVKSNLEDYCKSLNWDMPETKNLGPLFEAKGLPGGRYYIHEIKAVGDIPFEPDSKITLTNQPSEEPRLWDMHQMARQYPNETWMCALVAFSYRTMALDTLRSADINFAQVDNL